MSTFKDVEIANRILDEKKKALKNIKKTFADDGNSFPQVGRYNYVVIPEHLREPFKILLETHYQKDVVQAIAYLESVSHALSVEK